MALLAMQMEFTPQATSPAAVPCVVCADDVDVASRSSVTLPKPCGHTYCRGCIQEYVKKCCDDKEIFPPRCCGIRVPLDETVNNLLGQELAHRLELMIAEHDDNDKLYCSNLRCSRYLRQSALPRRRIPVRSIRCTACNHSTCRSCKYSSHGDRPCGASLAEDQVRALGAINGWRQCHRCKTMVERIEGCTHMTCRCGAQFCYICGVRYPQCGLSCVQGPPLQPAEIAAMEQAIQAMAPPVIVPLEPLLVPQARPRGPPDARNPPWRVNGIGATNEPAWWEVRRESRPVVDENGAAMPRRDAHPARRVNIQLPPQPRRIPRPGGQAAEGPPPAVPLAVAAAQAAVRPPQVAPRQAGTPRPPVPEIVGGPAFPAPRTPLRRRTTGGMPPTTDKFSNSRPTVVTPPSQLPRMFRATLGQTSAMQARNLLPSY